MSTSAHAKRIVIIAGPNGAGKTTFAREFLPTDAELTNFARIKGVSFAIVFFAWHRVKAEVSTEITQ